MATDLQKLTETIEHLLKKYEMEFVRHRATFEAIWEELEAAYAQYGEIMERKTEVRVAYLVLKHGSEGAKS